MLLPQADDALDVSGLHFRHFACPFIHSVMLLPDRIPPGGNIVSVDIVSDTRKIRTRKSSFIELHGADRSGFVVRTDYAREVRICRMKMTESTELLTTLTLIQQFILNTSQVHPPSRVRRYYVYKTCSFSLVCRV